MSHTVHEVRRSLITVAPALAIVPMMGDVAAKFAASAKPEIKKIGKEIDAEKAALSSSLDELGILEPIKAYREGRQWVAVDGRHRLEWADARGPKFKVPLLEVSKKDALEIIEASVIGRRHWTKGQRAWLGVLQHPEVSSVTPADSLKQNRSDSVGTEGGPALNATTLGARLGVSADIVTQAVQLYRLFFAPGAKAGSPEAIEAASRKEKYEHLIWGGAGLGAIIAGIGGGESTEGKPKAATGFQHLDAPLASLSRLSKHFLSWSPEERTKAQALIVARIRGSADAPGWPDEFRAALAEALVAAEA